MKTTPAPRAVKEAAARYLKIVEAHVADLLADRERLPAATAGKTYSGKFVVRIDPELHRKAALKASFRNESLNQYVAKALANA